MQISWSKAQSQLELSLAQHSPSLFNNEIYLQVIAARFQEWSWWYERNTMRLPVIMMLWEKYHEVTSDHDVIREILWGYQWSCQELTITVMRLGSGPQWEGYQPSSRVTVTGLVKQCGKMEKIELFFSFCIFSKIEFRCKIHALRLIIKQDQYPKRWE